ncbi:FTR1 family iron permease [Thalassospira xiamenensis]|jgi:high-affinity iron transporter|uniref:FTR1 family iron permease n=1 Tax=Thalassospira xiamenensis TaxID=220697 RepID=UPI00241FC262|nr:FTR1 family protein [Thalassospira xiamenensis]|tara:strand:+ start:544 stop:2868 length:2325 start_codon:yes stop_codon:yes gene_type:complete
MIPNAFRLAFMAFLIIAAPLSTGQAQTSLAWQDAEDLRSTSASLVRLMYRPADRDLQQKASEKLARVQSLWNNNLARAFQDAAPDQAAIVSSVLTDYTDAVLAWDAAKAASAHASLRTGMLHGAFERTVDLLASGQFDAASQWLNIREYARTSRDTGASIAMREALAGRLSADQARDVVEAELLGIYAGELRHAIAEARSDLARNYKIQLAETVSRAQGFHHLLAGNIAQRLGPNQANAITGIMNDLALPSDTASLDAKLSQLEELLATYAPTNLPKEELARRVRLLSRFMNMVPVEYEKGVRDGEITIPFEYFEARLFRDRAQMLYGDLGHDLSQRSPESLERLGTILSEMQNQIDRKGPSDHIRNLATEGQDVIASVYGNDTAQSGYQAALLLLPDLFDEILLVAQAGDWAEAELKRLEAYAFFDPDIEQRLVPRSPTLALKLESGFWEGSAAEPGLGRLIADQGSVEALKITIGRMKQQTAEAGNILDTQLSSAGAFIQSLAILLREGLEAVLILACMIGALKSNGVPAGGRNGWRLPILTGISLALAGSFLLWVAVGKLFAMSTLQRELLEGATALIAAAVLFYVTHWIFRKAYVGDWIAEIKQKTAIAANTQNRTGQRFLGWITLFSLAFLVVFREGFETVLFYEALLIDAPVLPVLGGLVAGAALALLSAFVILGMEARLPVTAFFRVTGGLLALLCIMLVGSGMRGLQTAALMPATPVTWFPDAPWLQLYLGLYPVAETLIAQGLLTAILLILLAIPAWWRIQVQKT